MTTPTPTESDQAVWQDQGLCRAYLFVYSIAVQQQPSCCCSPLLLQADTTHVPTKMRDQQCKGSARVMVQKLQCKHDYSRGSTEHMRHAETTTTQLQRWEECSAEVRASKHCNRCRSANGSIAMGRRSYRQTYRTRPTIAICCLASFDQVHHAMISTNSCKQYSSASDTTATGRRSYRQIYMITLMILICYTTVLASTLSITPAVPTRHFKLCNLTKGRTNGNGNLTKGKTKRKRQLVPTHIQGIHMVLQKCSHKEALLATSRCPHYFKIALSKKLKRCMKRQRGELLRIAYLIHRKGTLPPGAKALKHLRKPLQADSSAMKSNAIHETTLSGPQSGNIHDSKLTDASESPTTKPHAINRSPGYYRGNTGLQPPRPSVSRTNQESTNRTSCT
jgi:hypothetical protein